MSVNDFSKKVAGFHNLKSSEQIDFIVYYLLIILKQSGVKPKEVESCFDELHLSPYSNIGSYLSKFSKNGKTQKFIKKGNCYFLERRRKEEIDEIANNVPTPKPSNDLFPTALLDNTRGYLIRTGEQASVCYDLGLFDASLVMIRKLLETLIIECFERHGLEGEIKGKDGHFYFLSDLIGLFLSGSKWSLSRNTVKSLPIIKALGDLSAHNRRYIGKKPDIDKIKDDLRIVIEDIVHLIDYPNWNKK